MELNMKIKDKQQATGSRI